VKELHVRIYPRRESSCIVLTLKYQRQPFGEAVAVGLRIHQHPIGVRRVGIRHAASLYAHMHTRGRVRVGAVVERAVLPHNLV